MNTMDIRLRKIEKEDLEKIMMWRMQPSVTYYMNTDPKLTMSDQLIWFENISQSKDCMYWIMVADGVDIGVFSLIDIDYTNKRCAWQWYIGEEDFRGKGIAKRIQLNLYDYVFYTLGMHRLYSHILALNTHEIVNVHKRCGYIEEGMMKDHVCKNGEYLDVVVMGITVDEWERIKDSFEYLPMVFDDLGKELNGGHIIDIR